MRCALGLGAVAPPSEAEAFIKTLDPSAGYTVTNYITQDMTSIGTAWGGWTLSLTIDASLEGQLFQIGFANTCANYDPSSVIYDNVVKAKSPNDRLDVIFLSILGRRPTRGDRTVATQEIKSGGNIGYGNVIWALINTKEFLFIQ